MQSQRYKRVTQLILAGSVVRGVFYTLFRAQLTSFLVA